MYMSQIHLLNHNKDSHLQSPACGFIPDSLMKSEDAHVSNSASMSSFTTVVTVVLLLVADDVTGSEFVVEEEDDGSGSR